MALAIHPRPTCRNGWTFLVPFLTPSRKRFAHSRSRTGGHLHYLRGLAQGFNVNRRIYRLVFVRWGNREHCWWYSEIGGPHVATLVRKLEESTRVPPEASGVERSSGPKPPVPPGLPFNSTRRISPCAPSATRYDCSTPNPCSWKWVQEADPWMKTAYTTHHFRAQCRG